jgi:hypothetical protein
MAVDTKGNPIVAGFFAGRATFDGTHEFRTVGSSDAWIAKWSSDGEPLWSRQIGGTGGEVIWGVSSGPSNETVVSGYFENEVDFGDGPRKARGNVDAFVAKYDDDGGLVWAYDFGGPGKDTCGTVQTDDRGNVYPVGWHATEALVGNETFGANALYVLQLPP